MPCSILLVEDEPNILESLSFIVKQAGHRVWVARDGDAALRTMEASVPDLVILDVMMPRRDGLEVCREIRAKTAWRGVKVIMLTAKGSEIDRRKGLEMGADAYMIKPFSTREILEKIDHLIGKPRDGEGRKAQL